jgi:hypothetical protein
MESSLSISRGHTSFFSNQEKKQNLCRWVGRVPEYGGGSNRRENSVPGRIRLDRELVAGQKDSY